MAEPLTDEELQRFYETMQCDRYPDGVATRLLAEHAALRRDMPEMRRTLQELRTAFDALNTRAVELETRLAKLLDAPPSPDLGSSMP